MNSYHVIIPYAYGWVKSECNCSGNHGADGPALPVLIGNWEYSYSPGGVLSYHEGNIGGWIPYI